MTEFVLNDIEVSVTRKRIKNLYLRVHRATGKVNVTVPKSMSLDAVQAFIHSKFDWILKQKKKLIPKLPSLPINYVDGETLLFLGKQYTLKIVATKTKPHVQLTETDILLHLKPDTDAAKREMLFEKWRKKSLSEHIEKLIPYWEKVMQVSVASFAIRKMRSRWGSCSTRTRDIRFSLELASKPLECIEYVVVHELAHLIEPSHNRRFVSLMDHFLPHWRAIRNVLRTG